MNRYFFAFSIFSLFFFSCSSSQEALAPGSPVAEHGQLSVKNGKIVDSAGQPVQLRGMSLFWSQWQPKFYNRETVSNLSESWDIDLIRAAMAVENDGYLKNPEREMRKVEKVIDAAIEEGIYVIIDWHDHLAEDHLEQSKKFFSTVAEKYGSHPNIIYEPYNEPLDVSWSETLKPYHLAVIEAIRKHDKNNLIVVGTPEWSQRVDLAAQDPIEADNIAYTLHFYAGTHKEELREKARQAIQAQIPLFVTEFGTTDADGDGKVSAEETAVWWDFLEQHHISWANWSVADKDEASAALLPGTKASEVGKEENLSESGKLVRDKIRSSAN